MKITPKGQVTIPWEIREQLGLFPDTEVRFEVRGPNSGRPGVSSGAHAMVTRRPGPISNW